MKPELLAQTETITERQPNLGIVIIWDDFHVVGNCVPLLTHIYPSGLADRSTCSRVALATGVA